MTPQRIPYNIEIEFILAVNNKSTKWVLIFALTALMFVFGFLVVRLFGPNFLTKQKATTIKKEISVRSESPGYSLAIKDKDDLLVELEEQGFWAEGAVFNYSNKDKRYTPSTLEVVLVPSPEQEAFSVMNKPDGSVFAAVSAKVIPEDTATIRIYVAPGSEGAFDFAFWKGIYVLSKFVGKSSTQIDGGLAEQYAKSQGNEGLRFEVAKN